MLHASCQLAECNWFLSIDDMDIFSWTTIVFQIWIVRNSKGNIVYCMVSGSTSISQFTCPVSQLFSERFRTFSFVSLTSARSNIPSRNFLLASSSANVNLKWSFVFNEYNDLSRLTSSISGEAVNTAIEPSLTTWLMWRCSRSSSCKMWTVSSSKEKWRRGYDSRHSSSAISERSWWCRPSPETEDSADWPWRCWRHLNRRSESSWSNPQGHIVSLESCFLRYFLSEMYGG